MTTKRAPWIGYSHITIASPSHLQSSHNPRTNERSRRERKCRHMTLCTLSAMHIYIQRTYHAPPTAAVRPNWPHPPLPAHRHIKLSLNPKPSAQLTLGSYTVACMETAGVNRAVVDGNVRICQLAWVTRVHHGPSVSTSSLIYMPLPVGPYNQPPPFPVQKAVTSASQNLAFFFGVHLDIPTQQPPNAIRDPRIFYRLSSR